MFFFFFFFFGFFGFGWMGVGTLLGIIVGGGQIEESFDGGGRSGSRYIILYC